MRGLLLAALLAVAAGAAHADNAPVTAQPIVEAERAFAADGMARGVRDSFLAHMADEAIVFAPGPTGAKAFYGARPPSKPGVLDWWPVWAGIARSGDLGFTTGPYTVNGQPGAFYFTVWKKQADGTWKWIFDGGAGADPAGAPPKGSQPVYLPTSDQPGLYPEGAQANADRAEAALTKLAAGSGRDAFRAALACDGLIYTEGLAPARGCDAFGPALAGRPVSIVYVKQGGAISAAGDLAFVYGEARWNDAEAKPRHGQYARVWQRRAEGWKLVFDELIADPPPPPPSPKPA
jgi:ketosteroid isomerase-like protein